MGRGIPNGRTVMKQYKPKRKRYNKCKKCQRPIKKGSSLYARLYGICTRCER